MQEIIDWLLSQLATATDFFSLKVLVKTWLSPWKGDVQTAKNISLSDQAKLWEENLASRAVGFIIRTIVILISLLSIGIGAIVGLLALGVWLLGPVLIVAMPILGVFRR